MFAFGSVTLVGDNGLSARSPIAIKPLASSTMDVNPGVSVTLTRGRASFVPAQTFYTGNITAVPVGLTAGFATDAWQTTVLMVNLTLILT